MCPKSFVVGTLYIFFIYLNWILQLKALFDRGLQYSLSHSMVSAATKCAKLHSSFKRCCDICDMLQLIKSEYKKLWNQQQAVYK
jgi:hypothetical protein